jgi:hypothetical protein
MIRKRIGPPYQSYGKSTPREKVTGKFRRRHGYDPEEIRDAGAVWLAGPILDAIEEEPEAPQERDQVATPPSGAEILRAVAVQGDRMTPDRARELAGEQLTLWEAAT